MSSLSRSILSLILLQLSPCKVFHERDPSVSLLLIEAGPDSAKTALADATAQLVKVALLKGSNVNWNYETVLRKF